MPLASTPALITICFASCRCARPSPGDRHIVASGEAGLEEWRFVRRSLETEAVVGLDHDVGGEPAVVIGLWIIQPHKRPAAFPALNRRVNDQLSGIDHVVDVDRILPFVIRYPCAA